MHDDIPKSQLRGVYSDIIKGYSLVDAEKHGLIYVKHLNVWDTEKLDGKRDSYFNQAIRKGLPSIKEKVKLLEKDDLWSPKQEAKIKEHERFLSRMRETKRKLLLKSEMVRMSKDIDEEQAKLDKLLSEKNQLIGLTSELFADKKVNEYYIYLTLYKDKSLKAPFLTEEEFDEISDDQLGELVLLYNGVADKFSERNMKRVALSGFFLNNYYLCKDNPFTFYGKAIVDLTYHQSDLFSYGRYFKHVLSEMKHSPSPEIMEDPDKLLEHYDIQKNQEKMDESGRHQSGLASTVVGATKEDMEALGMVNDDPNTVDLGEELAKHGGRMTMEDMIKLHGV